MRSLIQHLESRKDTAWKHLIVNLREIEATTRPKKHHQGGGASKVDKPAVSTVTAKNRHAGANDSDKTSDVAMEDKRSGMKNPYAVSKGAMTDRDIIEDKDKKELPPLQLPLPYPYLVSYPVRDPPLFTSRHDRLYLTSPYPIGGEEIIPYRKESLQERHMNNIGELRDPPLFISRHDRPYLTSTCPTGGMEIIPYREESLQERYMNDIGELRKKMEGIEREMEEQRQREKEREEREERKWRENERDRRNHRWSDRDSAYTSGSDSDLDLDLDSDSDSDSDGGSRRCRCRHCPKHR